MVINSCNCNFVSTDKPMLGDFWSDKEVMTIR
jgi:hypothetical protein